jgi:hypothetical protein
MIRCHGQALIEYLLILVFIVGIGTTIVTKLSSFFQDTSGNLAHVLSINLTVGVCQSKCFFKQYKNGFGQ